MVNNGSLHYDHDRDGTHTMIGGCEVKFRNFDHDTYIAIRYENDVLTGTVKLYIMSIKVMNFNDPRGQPTVTAGSNYCFSALGVCASNHTPAPVPTFQKMSQCENLAKQNNFQVRIISLLAGLWVWPSGSLMAHMSCNLLLFINVYSQSWSPE